MVGDVVVQSVASDGSRGAIPLCCRRSLRRALAERLRGPAWLRGDLAVGELIAQLQVLAFGLADAGGEIVALLADRVWLAELAHGRGALGQHALELLLGEAERGGQSRAGDQVGILAAAEPSPRRRRCALELLARLVALLGQRQRADVEGLDALKLTGRQGLQLSPQRSLRARVGPRRPRPAAR